MTLPIGFEYIGNVSLVSSRVNPASAGSIKKEYPVTKEAPVKEETTGDVKDGKDSCCRCLGRDTIANAAARVCPAVVNLSAPRGMYLLFLFISHSI